MTETVVRVLTEQDWCVYRTLRLAGLQESPDAFVDSYAEEVGCSQEWWRSRMQRATRLLAECGDVPRGIASCAVDADDPGIAEVFGLWVDPATRQAGVAWSLTHATPALSICSSARVIKAPPMPSRRDAGCTIIIPIHASARP